MTHQEVNDAMRRFAKHTEEFRKIARSVTMPRPPDFGTFTEAVSAFPDIAPADPPAVSAFNLLVKEIRAFETELDDEHEIGATFVSDGSGVAFHVTGVGYSEPDIMIFWGATGAGQPVRLLQHVSQLNVLLTALPKRQEKPRRIGFALGAED